MLDEPETAVALLAEIWPATPPDAGPDFVHRLSDIGAQLTGVLPTSLLLAKALRRAAQSLRANDQLHFAAIHGMRELAIHRQRDNEPDATAEALHDLAQTYRSLGVLHKVIGCADETLETYLLHHHQPGIARTLTHLGALMIEAHRHDSAITYLTRADKAYAQLPEPTTHAESLVLLGQAQYLSGDHHTADRTLNRALSLIIRLDDRAARKVRALVAETRPA
ncbi:tetratricopeptide repeat protein [Actinosynnema sp. NPDC050801]|uniref:tetratricopeptide repeat protein n=1 Tax=unclassified Actinosynnema TaxID=2637065 RepID=UPI0033FD6BED